MKPNIYFVGAHSTGKTTLARWVSETYNIPMLTEVARLVLAQKEADLEKLRTDMSAIGRYQQEVFHRQLTAEASMEAPFVADRAFCSLAYTARHTDRLATLLRQPQTLEYLNKLREHLVVFVRPHKELLAEDGVRETPKWDEVLRIDGMIQLLLAQFEIPHIILDALSMADRTRTLSCVINQIWKKYELRLVPSRSDENGFD